MNYGIDIWGGNNFFIENGKLKVNFGNQPALIDIIKEIEERGFQGPILLRFPHLIRKQINSLYSAFNKAIKEFNYKGKFHAVFPLKVNQFPTFVKPLIKIANKFNYGLEAGSKAELILAMAYNNKNAPITINGFKDKDMIRLAFIAGFMGYDVTITIEGLNELNSIIEVSKEYEKIPVNIGIRIRLHTSGVGIWAKSGGIESKFGLSSTEIIEAIDILKKEKMLDKLKMIHFHIGSQINDISPLKKAIRESGNIYADLRKMGAKNLSAINIGGGLAIEYSQWEEKRDKNYSIEEFSNDVVYLLKEISQKKEVPMPDIFTESGRFIASPSTILIAPVIELFSQEYHEKNLKLKDKNPDLVEELYDLYKTINENNYIEYFHDALDHFESLLTLFDLGIIDLIDRSNSEILVNLMIKKAITYATLKGFKNKDLKSINEKIQEKYLANFSIFQSLPDFWGLGQRFPIMPLTKLNITPTRSATIWDITCDSDGEIPFSKEYPLYLHDVDLEKEDYYLGFFLVGAYQEILGMKHNLFSYTNEAIINFDIEGNYEIEFLEPTQKIREILIDLDYDIDEIERLLKNKLEIINDEEERKEILGELFLLLNDMIYLKND
ncbi:biosynthetic arginine decarboxylase [Caminibacter mediatlanticus TB-2]|uniref:Arginine decarboxylase n=1 Tax=Caminibacter mediatlanticus TB-2 TaxID=391592 RepID=A0AAI9AI70_9BACT|nr:biosynthetic arginine decarboxylase [Caminibacter mediatlanticus]EDM24091.1 arginine decarboxylase [Caminibacter mediatlanticus TB-2]QCT94453.1 biosynthetic arginine decarboxylase [Caminibacter mediatlanticus TB-2]